MTEQDAPTVARATLWLDTANETTTRRSGRLDAHPTRAFERPEPEHEPAATAFTAAAPADMQVLERGRPFAALESHDTRELSVLPRPKRWQRIASHAAAFVLGGTCALLVLGVTPHRDAARAQPRSAAATASMTAPQPVVPPAGTRKDPPSPAQLGLTLAVDALARGDYPAAHAQYAALARQHPNDAALSRIAARLAARSSEPCAGGTSTAEAPCAR